MAECQKIHQENMRALRRFSPEAFFLRNEVKGAVSWLKEA